MDCSSSELLINAFDSLFDMQLISAARIAATSIITADNMNTSV